MREVFDTTGALPPMPRPHPWFRLMSTLSSTHPFVICTTGPVGADPPVLGARSAYCSTESFIRVTVWAIFCELVVCTNANCRSCPVPSSPA